MAFILFFSFLLYQFAQTIWILEEKVDIYILWYLAGSDQ